MDFSQHGYVDVALILLVAFFLMLSPQEQSFEDIIVPQHVNKMCKCTEQFELTLYDNETIVFDNHKKHFAISDVTAIKDYLYGPFVNFSSKYHGVIIIKANENVDFSSLYTLTEQLKNSGANVVAWSRLY